ncbi:hypothetical protein COHA_001218 [Chlorella ohadii]|uniref:Uncharacterized protein n=1 Tax=Chlorella ohadii TaxID=2649997 RepID=A0AAD5DZ43_9CHLO|nr:hypothetical protein COHA_001218 [Chlorella ohadii]
MVLGAALVSERVNGYGLIEQLELDYPGIQPLLLGVAALLALAAVWPARRKAQDAVELVRQLAGRAAFGGLSAALAAEVWAGKGLLALLEVETGAQALSESEAVLAALLLLVLTGPRKTSSA